MLHDIGRIVGFDGGTGCFIVERAERLYAVWSEERGLHDYNPDDFEDDVDDGPDGFHFHQLSLETPAASTLFSAAQRRAYLQAVLSVEDMQRVLRKHQTRMRSRLDARRRAPG